METTHLALLYLVYLVYGFVVVQLGYWIGRYHGRILGRLDATRAQIARTDSLLNRWRQEQRP